MAIAEADAQTGPVNYSRADPAIISKRKTVMFSLSSRLLRQIVLVILSIAAMETANAADAANWKTWVISSGKDHGVPPPPNATATDNELDWLRAASQQSDSRIEKQIRHWDAGPPSYRWMEMVANRQSAGDPLGPFFVRAYTYVSLAIYDATIAAMNAKQTYNRPRPSDATGMVHQRVAVPASSSYPSDYAATAAAAAAVLAYLVPAEAAYFHNLAEEAGKSRLYAGVEYPSDYQAGMELGRRVAEKVIAQARADGSDMVWSGTVPTGPCRWTGSNPGFVTAAMWKPLLMTSPAEFRPPPPPACDSPQAMAELAEVRNYSRALSTASFTSNARAFYWQSNDGIYPWAVTQLNRWILEDRLERNPAEAARAYALLGAVGFDAFIASQDGKFTYWYPRPAQLDPSLTPLFPSPNFPSYPSNHSTFSAARGEVLAYLFPERADQIRAMAKQAGDSRVWAGIHFPMDNEAGVTMGKQIAHKFIDWAMNDGSATR
jgi:membrane-associated phospholipid phosphatase